MQLFIKQNRVDGDIVEIYQRYGNRVLFAGALHRDFFDEIDEDRLEKGVMAEVVELYGEDTSFFDEAGA